MGTDKLRTKHLAKFTGLWMAFLSMGTWIVPIGALMPARAAIAVTACAPDPAPMSPAGEDELFAQYLEAFGVPLIAETWAMDVPAAFTGRGIYELGYLGLTATYEPVTSKEITSDLAAQGLALIGARVFSSTGWVHSYTGTHPSTFIATVTSTGTRFVYTGRGSEEMLDAVAWLRQVDPDLSPVPEPAAFGSGIIVNEIADNVIPIVSPPPSSTGCAQLDDQIKACRDEFHAIAALHHDGLLNQLDALAQHLGDQRDACASAWRSTTDGCNDAYAIAVSGASAQRSIAISAARTARYDTKKAAVIQASICIAGAHVYLALCLGPALASGPFAPIGVGVCAGTFLVAFASCGAILISSFIAADQAYANAVNAAQQAYAAAIVTADATKASCIASADAVRDSCIASAGQAYHAAACAAVATASTAFRAAVINFRSCVRQAYDYFAESCADTQFPVQYQDPLVDWAKTVEVEDCPEVFGGGI